MATVFLKPKDEQTKVRYPVVGGYLPAAGVDVELTSYWRRRCRNGDVIQLDEKEASKARTAIKALAKEKAEAAAKQVVKGEK